MSGRLVLLLAAYLDHLRARGIAARTIVERQLSLGRFIAELAERGIERARDVTRNDLIAFQQGLLTKRSAAGRPLALGTQAYLVGRVRHFFHYLVRAGHLLVDPTVVLELPRLPVRLPARILSLEEMNRLLIAPDLDDRLGLRDRAILELLYSTGVRATELAQLDTYDIDLAAGEITIRRGKGGKGRRLPVGAAAVQWVRRYLEGSRAGLLRRQREPALFMTWRGRRMTRASVRRVVADHAQIAKIPGDITPHTIRHTFATHMIRGRASLRHVQELLGHARVTTTQIYTRVDLTDLKEVHRRCHPRGRA